MFTGREYCDRLVTPVLSIRAVKLKPYFYVSVFKTLLLHREGDGLSGLGVFP